MVQGAKTDHRAVDAVLEAIKEQEVLTKAQLMS